MSCLKRARHFTCINLFSPHYRSFEVETIILILKLGNGGTQREQDDCYSQQERVSGWPDPVQW